jgi:hypothetical protein
MNKRIVRYILGSIAILILGAIALPLLSKIFLVPYPDRIIKEQGVRPVLESLQNSDLECSISCCSKNLILPNKQIESFRNFLADFFANAKVRQRPHEEHTIKSECAIALPGRGKSQDLIFLYIHLRMIEIQQNKNWYVFMVENQDFIDLLSALNTLSPTQDLDAAIQTFRRETPK